MAKLMDNMPLDTVVWLIDDMHRLYKGTMTMRHGELHRGECIEGDPDRFYRNTMIAWAWVD